MLRMNNSIIDLVTPEMNIVQQNQRFTPASQRVIGKDVPKLVQDVPGDATRAGLPIPCYVEFTAARMRGAPDGESWLRTGLLIIRQSALRETFQITEGTIVRFARTIPGKERFWYKVETMESTPSTFSGQPTTITYELSEVQTPMDGIAS